MGRWGVGGGRLGGRRGAGAGRGRQLLPSQPGPLPEPAHGDSGAFLFPGTPLLCPERFVVTHKIHSSLRQNLF